MVEFYLQIAKEVLILTAMFLLPYGVRAQNEFCDSLDVAFKIRPDVLVQGEKFGWAFDDLSEPTEGIRGFINKKKSIERIDAHVWNAHCEPTKESVCVRISFFVLPSGKAVCFVPSDTICQKLNDLAIQFLRQTKFKPAKKDGLAVLHKNSYPFTFIKSR